MVSGDDEVTGQHELEPARDRGPADPGGAHARAEGPVTGSGQRDRGHTAVGVGGRQRRDERAHGSPGPGIAALGPVEGDQRDDS